MSDTRFLHKSNGYGELDTGKTILAFASHQLGEMNLPSGALADAPPNQKPWGQTVAYFGAIEGTLIELCTPIGA